MEPRPPMPDAVLFRDTRVPTGSPGASPEHGRQTLMVIRKGKSGGWGGPIVLACRGPASAPLSTVPGPAPSSPVALPAQSSVLLSCHSP